MKKAVTHYYIYTRRARDDFLCHPFACSEKYRIFAIDLAITPIQTECLKPKQEEADA